MTSRPTVNFTPRLRSTLLASSCLLALAMTACTDKATGDANRRDADAALDKTEKAAVAAGNKAAEMAELARDKTRAFVTSPEVRQDAAAVKDAFKNVGSAALSTTDDAAITVSISAALAKDPELSARQIDIETKGGAVRLAGPAPNAAAKARAGEIARSVKGVASVDNVLEVKAM